MSERQQRGVLCRVVQCSVHKYHPPSSESVRKSSTKHAQSIRRFDAAVPNPCNGRPAYERSRERTSSTVGWDKLRLLVRRRLCWVCRVGHVMLIDKMFGKGHIYCSLFFWPRRVPWTWTTDVRSTRLTEVGEARSLYSLALDAMSR